jgi:hypothetical protein
MDQALPTLLVVVAALALGTCLIGVLLVLGGRRRMREALDSARAEVAALRSRVDELTRRVDSDGAEAPAGASADRAGGEYVITSVRAPGTEVVPPGSDDAETAPVTVSAREFASVALGESLVRIVSFGYGVKRALSPENRNRIAFEVGREVKRSRRQRRRDLKQARRHLRTERPGGGGLHEDAA